MPAVAEPRLPFAPLLRLTGCDTATTAFTVNAGTYREATGHMAAPQTTLAELAGVSRRSAARWAREGIPLRSAEDVCHALGLHPCEVWGDEWIGAAGGVA